MAFDEMLSEHQVYLFERNGFVNAGPLISEAEADQLANEILTIIERREDSNFPQPLRIANRSRNRLDNNPASVLVNTFLMYFVHNSPPYTHIHYSTSMCLHLLLFGKAFVVVVIFFFSSRGSNTWKRDAEFECVC